MIGQDSEVTAAICESTEENQTEENKAVPVVIVLGFYQNNSYPGM